MENNYDAFDKLASGYEEVENLFETNTQSSMIDRDLTKPLEEIDEAEIVDTPSAPLTEEERKERYKNYLMGIQELDFYQKHNFMMDGKTRRRVRKTISAKVDKGLIRVPDDIDLNNYSE